jgi:hypothetical protein
MIVFCCCGSDKVIIQRWDKDRALFKCCSCEQERWVEGFTLGRFDFVEQLFGAVLDQARKYRERNPEEKAGLLRERMLARKLAERR